MTYEFNSQTALQEGTIEEWTPNYEVTIRQTRSVIIGKLASSTLNEALKLLGVRETLNVVLETSKGARMFTEDIMDAQNANGQPRAIQDSKHSESPTH